MLKSVWQTGRWLLLAQLLMLRSLLAQGSVLLVGGGSENDNDWSDAPYRWLVQHAPNREILILHYDSPSSFLPNYFKSLGAANAANLVINSRSSANDSANYRAILQAGGLFLRGGDQWQYVSLWQGTLASQAIQQVFQTGGAIGGTSAGAMVLSEIVFDARTTSVDPRQALRNPLRAGITFTSGFLALVPNALADTHFYERGRLGRLAAMLAVYHSQQGRWLTGLGVDDRTALAIAPDGSAEVFGSGVVTLLRAGERIAYTVQMNQPLALSELELQQFTAGFRLDLAAGHILTPAAGAASFSASPFQANGAGIWLEGSDQSSDWFAAGGSFAGFLDGFTAGQDTLGIISSPAVGANAQTVAQQLAQRGFSSHLLWLDSSTRNDQLTATRMQRSAGLIFAGNSLDSVAVHLAPATATGQAFAAARQAGRAMLFLGNDAKLAGSTGVGQTEVSTTAAYRGRLTLFNGLGLLGSTIIMPRAWQDSDYHENRLSGLLWGMAKAQAAFGVLLDAGSHLDCRNGVALFTGLTPALVIDSRPAQWRDFSTYRAASSVGPRQSAALDHARVHVLPNGSRFDFNNGAVVQVESRHAVENSPLLFHLEQNHPNPFNPHTLIRYHLSEAATVTLRVFDLAGREVATLVQAQQAAGTHAAGFDGSALASGLYLYRLEAGGRVASRKMLLMR
ncbi:MAG: hypothetical protein DKINENOH_05412 [bacterium]|nr:hypothetical protein [bacterium]